MKQAYFYNRIEDLRDNVDAWLKGATQAHEDKREYWEYHRMLITHGVMVKLSKFQGHAPTYAKEVLRMYEGVEW